MYHDTMFATFYNVLATCLQCRCDMVATCLQFSCDNDNDQLRRGMSMQEIRRVNACATVCANGRASECVQTSVQMTVHVPGKSA